MLTTAELKKLSKIVHGHMGAAIWLTTGLEPFDQDIRQLRDLIAPTASVDALKDAYLYGMLSSVEDIEHLSYDEIKAKLSTIPLGAIELEQIAWLQENAGLYCRGLGNTIEAGTLRIVHDAAKEVRMQKIIQDTLAAGTEERKTRSQIITDLRDFTMDKQRDWHRIVNTELHSARTQGIARGIEKNFGSDEHIIVRPYHDCCDMCDAAYLDGGKPKIFKLSELAARNNIGRKKADLIGAPGLPPLHPHCFCQVQHFDRDMHEFDSDGRVVFKKS